MRQEDKQLLLQDLSARLPYGVMCNIGLKYPLQLQRIFVDKVDGILLDFYEGGKDYQVYLSEVKPYLRPMSSMTEEEFEKLKEYSGLKYEQLDLASFQNGTYKCLDFYLSEVPSYVVILVFDWLNAHHFDYRGLIEKGLTIEAPKGMYNLAGKLLWNTLMRMTPLLK